ncbi:MAG TPA: Ku protein, partial [Thermoanaerobaculia bacterium]|nr:Ku protein [Thermoanaerobaculia bacterium]
VPIEQVDPIYFEKSTYLGPDRGGDRPYRLLSQAMRETGRAALARYRARGKDYLVLMRPYEEGLMMQHLRYADEVRSFTEVPVAPAEVKEPELRLAIQLIEQIASDKFQPEQYEDEVRKRTRDLIEQKVQGQEISAAPVEAPKAQIIDLMEALKASLANVAPAQPAAKPVSITARKGPKPSPRAVAEPAETADTTPRKKTGSKR